jgi:hypothetical protein
MHTARRDRGRIGRPAQRHSGQVTAESGFPAGKVDQRAQRQYAIQPEWRGKLDRRVCAHAGTITYPQHVLATEAGDIRVDAIEFGGTDALIPITPRRLEAIYLEAVSKQDLAAEAHAIEGRGKLLGRFLSFHEREGEAIGNLPLITPMVYPNVVVLDDYRALQSDIPR